MDLILYSDGLFELVKLNYNFNFAVMDLFEYCDAFREALAVYNYDLNTWIMKKLLKLPQLQMKNGSHFIGCVANENY